MTTCYIAIGSNLGDRNANIEKALALLQEDGKVLITKRSPLYETEPLGGPPQGKFLNGAIEVETDLFPLELFSKMKNVERLCGRRMEEPKNLPRPIDMDLIIYGESRFKSKTLEIPHPEALRRRFVLEPLKDVAGDVMFPGTDKTIKQLFEELTHEGHPIQTDNAAPGPAPQAKAQDRRVCPDNGFSPCGAPEPGETGGAGN